MITVKEVAQLVEKDGIKLITGSRGLDKVIDYFNVQEIAGKSPWIRPNGCILTTFDNFTSMNQIIEHLEWYLEKGISAIGFHTALQRKIPNEILAFANNANLPIFTFPPNVPYHILYERVNDHLTAQTLALKEEVDSVNENMLNAVILEKEVHHIVYMIGDYLNTPIIYTNEQLQPSAIWSDTSYTSRELTNIVAEVIEEEKEIIDSCIFENITVQSKQYYSHGKEISFHISPVSNKDDFFGCLFVAIPEQKYFQFETIIKHGITALILDALKRNATKEFLKSRDIMLFEDIFAGRERAELTKDKVHYYFFEGEQVMLARTNDLPSLREQFMRLKSLLQTMGQENLMWIQNNQIIGILSEFVSRETADKITEKIAGLTIGLSGKLLNFSTADFKLIYDQAVVSLDYALIHHQGAALWDELKTYRVIQELNNSNLLQDFDKDILGPLLQYDQENNADLVRTLDVYLQCFFSLKNSADLLFVHPNTVRYRIEKAKEILPDLDFQNPETYMSFALALKLHFHKNQS